MVTQAADITIFTTYKPSCGKDAWMQCNTIASWRACGLPVVLVGNEEGCATAVPNFNYQHIAEVVTGIRLQDALQGIAYAALAGMGFRREEGCGA